MSERPLARLAGSVLLASIALAGCRDTGGDDAYFELSGRLVVFNYREAKVTFLATLNPLRPIVDGMAATTTMDNPAGGEDLVIHQKLSASMRKVTIESPPLECVVKDRPYKVAIRIEDAKGGLLQAIDTEMISSQDQDMLPDRPLVVGPGYAPNPELAGHPDGKLPGGRGVACPSDA